MPVAAIASNAQNPSDLAGKELSGMEEIRDYFLSEGLGTERIDDLIKEARIFLETENFEKLHESYKFAGSLKKLAIRTLNATAEAEKLLGSLESALDNSSISILENLLEKAKSENKAENYEAANSFTDSFYLQISSIMRSDFESALNQLNESRNLAENSGIKLAIIGKTEEKIITAYNDRFKNYPAARKELFMAKSLIEILSDLNKKIEYLRQRSRQISIHK